MAVTTESVVGWKLTRGAFSSVAFSKFLRSLDTDGRDVILMDNASIHKAAPVWHVLEDRQFTPCFLPPYTPVFQPIEHRFSVMKTAYRQVPVAGSPCAFS